ncbi:MAG: hypothetical protein CUN55_19950, partial [Phototrophicales bacterium]
LYAIAVHPKHPQLIVCSGRKYFNVVTWHKHDRPNSKNSSGMIGSDRLQMSEGGYFKIVTNLRSRKAKPRHHLIAKTMAWNPSGEEILATGATSGAVLIWLLDVRSLLNNPSSFVSNQIEKLGYHDRVVT